MSPECLEKYCGLLEEADAMDKGKDSAGKPAKGKADDGKTPGPRQRAQQLNNQRFNKIISDIANKKLLFMSFVRFPARLQTNEGVLKLLEEI